MSMMKVGCQSPESNEIRGVTVMQSDLPCTVPSLSASVEMTTAASEASRQSTKNANAISRVELSHLCTPVMNQTCLMQRRS